MKDELVPKPSSEEVELQKMSLEVDERKIDSRETVHKGWQEVVKDIAGKIEETWSYGKESEIRFSRNVLYLILFLFGVVASLTYLGTIPGQALTFLTGTIVGYLLAVTPLTRGKWRGS